MDYVQHIILESDSRIEDVAVVKIPDETELFVNKAFVVLAEGIEATEQLQCELLENLKTNPTFGLKAYEVPKSLVFIDGLPRKAGMEKVDYTQLEELAGKL